MTNYLLDSEWLHLLTAPFNQSPAEGGRPQAPAVVCVEPMQPRSSRGKGGCPKDPPGDCRGPEIPVSYSDYGGGVQGGEGGTRPQARHRYFTK